jgi:hypothetical protein
MGTGGLCVMAGGGPPSTPLSERAKGADAKLRLHDGGARRSAKQGVCSRCTRRIGLGRVN